MSKEALNHFCTELLKKHRKETKSIWLSGSTVNVLLLDISKPEISEISDYFRNVMEGDINTYKGIREASLIYDPGHFVQPIKKMVKTGMIHGTKEALMRKFHAINQHFRQISREKLRILDNIYMSVIEASQATILASGNPIPVPRQVPVSMEKHFVSTGLLEKKYLTQCKTIVEAFKSVEHRDRAIPSGIELDRLQILANSYRERLKELIVKL
jgi:hypothetical protein